MNQITKRVSKNRFFFNNELGYVKCHIRFAILAPFGKRSWKMFFCTLRDLVLYLHKDEHGFNKKQVNSVKWIENCGFCQIKCVPFYV